MTAYDRKLLVAVLVEHQRQGSASCLCGWSVLGASHCEHVADAYEAAAVPAVDAHPHGPQPCECLLCAHRSRGGDL